MKSKLDRLLRFEGESEVVEFKYTKSSCQSQRRRPHLPRVTARRHRAKGRIADCSCHRHDCPCHSPGSLPLE